jgi:chloramphenicol-sensitive protein RarD
MNSQSEKKQGVIYGVMAYTMWGFFPIYVKWLSAVPPAEVLMQRIIWSFVLMGLVIVATKQWGKVRQVLKQPLLLLKLLGTSLLLAINWAIFIWSVSNDRVLDASLGYYINPLVSILLAGLFLQERLRLFQGVAVGLAFSGVLIQVISFGSFPVISLALGASFAFYGLFRKKMQVDSLVGLLIESAVMVPLAAGYWWFFADSSATNMFENSALLNLLLLGTGIATTVPLLCFTAGSKRLQYTTMGFLQYIGPSIMFVVAVVLYNEDVGMDRWVTFAFIWAALIVFSWDAFKRIKQHSQK